jgi:hypothetical protein
MARIDEAFILAARWDKRLQLHRLAGLDHAHQVFGCFLDFCFDPLTSDRPCIAFQLIQENGVRHCTIAPDTVHLGCGNQERRAGRITESDGIAHAGIAGGYGLHALEQPDAVIDMDDGVADLEPSIREV